MNTSLETEQMRLREFTVDDADRLLALDSDPDVVRYVRSHRFHDPESYQLANAELYRQRVQSTFMAYYKKSPGIGFWAAEEKASGDFMGWFHLRPGLDYKFAKEAGYRDGDLDLGYRFHVRFWGRGFATEGSRLLVRRAFEVLGAERVVATALEANRASTRVMENVGMRFDRTISLPGFDDAAVTYVITRQEYLDLAER